MSSKWLTLSHTWDLGLHGVAACFANRITDGFNSHKFHAAGKACNFPRTWHPVLGKLYDGNIDNPRTTYHNTAQVQGLKDRKFLYMPT